MKTHNLRTFSLTCTAATVLIGVAASTQAAPWVKNAQGVYGYGDTAKLPWCQYRKHDSSRPQPPRVDPGSAGAPVSAPSDAIVLFNGTDLASWQPSTWTIKGGAMVAGAGNIVTKQAFGDCQIHLEFRVPKQESTIGNRGNSGVFPMSIYEIQIFDSHPSHAEQIYPDGQCASVYGETPPLVNACRAPGEWQTYDLVFTAPVFKNGEVVTLATVTLLQNGILVQSATPVHGPCAHRNIAPCRPHAERLPLALQGHGSPVEFRNIWIRPLSGE